MKPLPNTAFSVAFPASPGLRKVKGVSESRYVAKMVETSEEFAAVLSLRSDVFKRELAGAEPGTFANEFDFDEYDLRCEHIIVQEKKTGEAVGTYRLNSLESAGSPDGFYASQEFSVEDLPGEVLAQAVELGRACIAKDHRNSRVLFLLWKVLANYLVERRKRYLFGCCSIFTQEGRKAAKVLEQLRLDGHIHSELAVGPRPDKKIIPAGFDPSGEEQVELPPLVNIYLRIGAKVCGEPAIDRDMKTIDYFVVFDLDSINPKYRKMFFG